VSVFVLFLLIFAGAAALGAITGWFAPHSIRPLAPLAAVLIAFGAFALARHMTFNGDHAMEVRALPFYFGLAALAFAAGGSGFALASNRRIAVFVSVVVGGMLVLSLPVTGLVMGCSLIGACP
jgi:hypothetical protein